jgi:hypothetical protein
MTETKPKVSREELEEDFFFLCLEHPEEAKAWAADARRMAEEYCLHRGFDLKTRKYFRQ